MHAHDRSPAVQPMINLHPVPIHGTNLSIAADVRRSTAPQSNVVSARRSVSTRSRMSAARGYMVSTAARWTSRSRIAMVAIRRMSGARSCVVTTRCRMSAGRACMIGIRGVLSAALIRVVVPCCVIVPCCVPAARRLMVRRRMAGLGVLSATAARMSALIRVMRGSRM
jgi:hypothetical protein